MSWLRIDDGFVENPKVMGVSDRAFRLHVSALCFCARNLTDGVLSARSVKVVCALTSASRRHVGELVAAGLWVEGDDGFEVKDFLDYNASAEQVKEKRRLNAERQQRWREKSRDAETGRFEAASEDEPDTTDTPTNGTRNALRNAAPSRPLPAGDQDQHLSGVSTEAQDVETQPEDPAAAKPASDRAIVEAVRSLRDADGGSPRVVMPLACRLPRSAFEEAVKRTRERQGGVGLLVTLLRIEAAERTAAIEAQIAATMPRRRLVPVPWTAEALRKEAPDLYVRRMAATLRDDDLRVALDGHDEHVIDGMLELAHRVRAGDECELERRETPARARRRWVEEKSAETAFPMDEIVYVIGAWDDVDDVEREQLRELADGIRDRAQTTGEEVAA